MDFNFSCCINGTVSRLPIRVFSYLVSVWTRVQGVTETLNFTIMGKVKTGAVIS